MNEFEKAADLSIPMPVDGNIEVMIKRGFTDDEIADKYAQAGNFADSGGRRLIKTRARALRGLPPIAVPVTAELPMDIVRAYRQARTEAEPRPSQEAVARQMKRSEEWLRLRRRSIGLDHWHDVHPLMAALDEAAEGRGS